MKKLLLIALLICTPAFAEDKLKLEVITNDYVPEVGVPYVDAQRFICQDSETQRQCYERNKAEIDSQKAIRISNYVQAVRHPAIPKEPTKAELLAEQTAITEQVAQLEARKVELSAKIAAIKVEPIFEEAIIP